MNLENLGVQEMNAQDVKNVDGGIVWILLAGALGMELIREGPVECYNSMMKGMEKSINDAGYTI